MRRTLALAGAAVLAVGITGLAGPAAADSDAGIASHGVVINELSANLVNAGTTGNIDGDFIEIVNHTGSPVNVGGWEVSTCDATNPIEPFVAIPVGTTLDPNETYLLADDAYLGGSGPLPDQEFPADADLEQNASGVRLVNSSSILQDAVKWGAPMDSICASFPAALDSSGNPINPTNTQSINRDHSIDRWFHFNPTPQHSTP